MKWIFRAYFLWREYLAQHRYGGGARLGPATSHAFKKKEGLDGKKGKGKVILYYWNNIIHCMKKYILNKSKTKNLLG